MDGHFLDTRKVGICLKDNDSTDLSWCEVCEGKIVLRYSDQVQTDK